MERVKYDIKTVLRLLLLHLFFVPSFVHAQVEQLDSAYLAEIEQLVAEEEMRTAINSYSDHLMREEMKFEYSDLVPLVKGIISVYSRHDFIYNHPAVFKNTNSKWKDYGVASAPLVTAWIMKAAGVKSRSTTRRMVTSNAFALALAAGLTEGTKHLVNEPRPDISDNHSFPSGHTALAYVGATVLSREFGHVSPWITVGAYSAATATELLRIKHNSHWLNDIYMGAGIGVVATNFGYWLSDRIYGEKGINRPEMTLRDVQLTLKMMDRPSSFALVASADMGSNTIESEALSFSKGMGLYDAADFHIHLSSFSLAGVEASWFVNPYLALEAVAQSSIAQGKVYGPSDMVFTGNSVQMYRGGIAVKGSMPLPGTASRLAMRAIGGARHVEASHFYQTEVDVYNPMPEYTISIPKETKFELGCGLSYDIMSTKSHVVGFNFDYYHAFSKVTPNRFQLGTVWRVLF